MQGAQSNRKRSQREPLSREDVANGQTTSLRDEMEDVMFPYLRLILVPLWVACTAGVVLIVGLSLGFVSLATFVWAGVIGIGLGVPAGLLNWAYLRPRRSRQIGWNWRLADWVRDTKI